MRSLERDFLLTLLAAASGSADGWSYFGLGHSFVANMTGNTVLIGLAVFQVNGDLLHPSISLACYALGAVLGSFLTRKLPAQSIWPNAVSKTLLIESLLMVAAEFGWAFLRRHGIASQLLPHSLLACVAFAIGIQSGAMLQLKIPGIVTTYITGTWTTLMNGLVRLPLKQRREPAGETDKFEGHLLLQAGILVVYLLSAIVTGWFFRYAPAAVGIIPAASVLLAALYGLFRNSNRLAAIP